MGTHEALHQNESEETIKTLRPKVEEAVRQLIAERGLPPIPTARVSNTDSPSP